MTQSEGQRVVHFEEEDDQTLNDFLDWVSLASDIDKYDQSNDRVTLMTLHTAKGLEYPVVLITGLEEGLLPHFRSISDSQQLEEERRLFYVGITRAKSRLYLSSAYSRRYFGKDQRSNPSRFLGELPLELMKCNTFDDLYDYRNLKHKSSSLTDEGIELNYIESPDKESRLDNHNLNKGQGVEHSVFGKGIILKVEGNDENAKVTVMFRVAGKKTILASFLE